MAAKKESTMSVIRSFHSDKTYKSIDTCDIRESLYSEEGAKEGSKRLNAVLSKLKGVIIKQELDIIEITTRIETQNRYVIKNLKGQDLLKANELSTFIIRNCCCSSSRPFIIKLLTFDNEEIMRITRPWRCQSCWFPCCLQFVNVYSPMRTQIGSVCQIWSPFRPFFRIYDSDDEEIYSVVGSVCKLKMCGTTKFKVYTPDDVKVGEIKKEWRGLFTEFFAQSITDADIFEIAFPEGAEPRNKALLMAACFLLDYMYFERTPKGKNRSRNDCCCCSCCYRAR